MKLWKSYHKGPVSKVALSKEGLQVASADINCIKVHDIEKQLCTNKFENNGIVR